MSTRIAIYARVSTYKQSTDNQLLELRTLCTKLGYTIVQECTDNGMSGAKSCDDVLRLICFSKALQGGSSIWSCVEVEYRSSQ
jgi:predicted site-specific integrase-resolvase